MHGQHCVPLPLGTARCHICWNTCPSQRPAEAAAQWGVHRAMVPAAPRPLGCHQAGKWLPFPGSRCQRGLLLTDPIPAAPPANEHYASIEQHHRGGAGRGQQLSWQDALALGAILRCF